MTPSTAARASRQEPGAHQLSDRLRARRDRILGGTRQISLIRAEAFSEALLAETDEPRTIRMANGLALTLDRLPARIAHDERIVGALTEKPLGAALFPEVHSGYLIKELDTFSVREQDRFAISDEDKDRLRNTILPPWLGASGNDELYRKLSPDAITAMWNLASIVGMEFGGTAHQAGLDFRRVVDRGYRAIIEDARAGMAALDPYDRANADRAAFYRSVSAVAEASIAFAHRYADQALALAVHATAERAAELRAIAATARRVPAEPARTFAEAVQSFWFVYLTLMQTDAASEVPLGRLDQLLGPYYDRDLAAGRITPEGAVELLAELLLKCNELAFLVEYAATKIVDGNHFRNTVTIGGTTPDGADATNAVSAALLAAAHAVRLTQPNLAVRLHPGTDPAFRAQVNEAMTSGANLIEVFNDEVIVAGFTAAGIDLAAANDYVITGCVEPLPAGGYGPACAAQVNAPKALEMALNGGTAQLSLDGASTERPVPGAGSYPELWQQVAAQLQTNLEVAVEAVRVAAEIQDRLLPNPALSILIDGCLESAVDVKAGGARYNLTGVNVIGLGTLTDSLAAIEEIVYTRGKHSLAEVVRWCKADFGGYEPQRQMLINHGPKFGNDDPRADMIAAAVVDHAAAVLRRYTPYRGGLHALGLHSEAHHIYQGAGVAATPDGRREGSMLSPGAGPSAGAAQHGPTAVLRSLANLDLRKVTSGSSVNLRFNPALLRTPAERAAFSAMVDAYFRMGGQHLQVNIVDVATLRDAQAHPERHRDLIVRVTGYCARFVELSLATQEEIIQRTEMGRCQ